MSRIKRSAYDASHLVFCLIAFCALLVGLAMPTKADQEINTGYFGNVAIKGYDPVAYFTEGEALRGSPDYSHEWLGAKWLFINEQHRALFADSPQNYAPQYGGHCATGMGISGGLTTDIDPEAWQIIDSKLYLNYSKETNKLLSDGIVTVDMADANWATVKQDAQ